MRDLHSGGHIGDGIRPSGEKKKRFALAPKKARKLGIERVLMCRKDNIGSAKFINISCNLWNTENEVLERTMYFTQRY